MLASEKRDISLDCAKGLGIMLIIIGHTITPDWLHSWIFSFHVPLFFIVSGYLFKQRKLLNVIEKGWKQLLRPMLITQVVCFCGLCVFFSKTGTWNGPDFLTLLTKYFLMLGEGARGMWFLSALFFSKMFMTIICSHSEKYISLIAIILFYISCMMHKFSSYIPFYFIQGMACVIFLYIGQLIKRFNLLHFKYDFGIILLCALVIVCGYRFYLNTADMLFPFGIFSLIIASLIGASVLVVFHYIETQQTFMNFLRVLSYIGKNSLLILCLHSFVHTLQLQDKVDLIHPYAVGVLECLIIVIIVPWINKIGLVYRLFHS